MGAAVSGAAFFPVATAGCLFLICLVHVLCKSKRAAEFRSRSPGFGVGIFLVSRLSGLRCGFPQDFEGFLVKCVSRALRNLGSILFGQLEFVLADTSS